MAFRNTSERYDYIFGSNARKLDREEKPALDYSFVEETPAESSPQKEKKGKATYKKAVVKKKKVSSKKANSKKKKKKAGHARSFLFLKKSKKPVKGKAKPAQKRELSPFEQRVLALNLERMRAFDWKYTLIILLAVFMVVSGSMIYVHETAVIKAKEQQVYDLKEKKEDLLGKQSALKGQIDKSINLKEIKTYAKKNLNMTMPDKKHTLYYSGGSGSYFYQFESVDAGK